MGKIIDFFNGGLLQSQAEQQSTPMHDKHFTANPASADGLWFVWDMHAPLPPTPVFFGSMEEAGMVADALNVFWDESKRAAMAEEGS
jgi:hypothetical protein